jgi:hypothetical protein
MAVSGGKSWEIREGAWGKADEVEKIRVKRVMVQRDFFRVFLIFIEDLRVVFDKGLAGSYFSYFFF